MVVKQRVIWTTDEEWRDIGEMAKVSGMTRSRLIVETVQVHIPDVPRTTTSDVPRPIASHVPRATPDPTDLTVVRSVEQDAAPPFRPAPKPGKR